MLQAGCLGPGEMLEVDPGQGRVIWNDEIRNRYANEKPYRDWLDEETLAVDDLEAPAPGKLPAERDANVGFTRRLAKLGYRYDDVQELVRPMAEQGKVPLASMGTDAPLACLSKRQRKLLRLLQPAVRPGHEPADRCAARKLRHQQRAVRGQPRQHARGLPRHVPPGAPGKPHAHA